MATIEEFVASVGAHKFPAIIGAANVVLATVAFFVQTFQSTDSSSSSWIRYIVAILVPSALAFSAFKKRSVVLSGALFGMLIAHCMFIGNVVVGMSLIVCYFATNRATRYNCALKARFEVDFKKGGQRNWVQVVSNLGIANVFLLCQIIFYGIGEFQIDFHHPNNLISADYGRSWLLMGALSAIACALGDTLSSELGPVWAEDQDPLLILNLQPVPRGTNGGVTIAGLFAAILGGFIIGLGAWVLQFFFSLFEPERSLFLQHWSSPQWPIIAFCIYAGLFGSIVDSIYGALFQYTAYDRLRKKLLERPLGEGEESTYVEHITGRDWLDNHDVNCAAILTTALITPIFAAHFWPSGVAI